MARQDIGNTRGSGHGVLRPGGLVAYFLAERGRGWQGWNAMKQVFSSPDVARVALNQSVLEGAKIFCEMRNEAVSQVMVGFQFAPELWVRDEDYEKAVNLLEGSQNAA